MRARLLSLALAGATAGLAMPAHAAKAPTPQITDPAGDANGLNDQGVGAPVPEQTTPAADAGADITSVLFQSTVTGKGKKKQVTGFTITLALAGAPQPGTIYRVAGAAGSCASLFFEYTTSLTATKPGSARCAGIPTSTPVDITDASVKGNSVVWTVPVSSFPVGTVISGLNAQTRFNATSPGITAPQIDYASSSNTFTVGK